MLGGAYLVGHEDSAGTLDSFFLPAKQEYLQKNSSGGVDLGIDLAALKEILSGHVFFQSSDGHWSFGIRDGGDLSDHHRFPREMNLVTATRSFILEKYREGFSPRSQNRVQIPDLAQLRPLADDLIEEVMDTMNSSKD